MQRRAPTCRAVARPHRHAHARASARARTVAARSSESWLGTHSRAEARPGLAAVVECGLEYRRRNRRDVRAAEHDRLHRTECGGRKR
jgi:hypothetical protein